MFTKKNNEKSFDHPELGEITLRKIKGSKSIRIHLGEELKVTLPFYCKFSDAERFVLEKKDWIIANRPQISQFSPEKNYRTYEHELEFIQSNISEVKTRIAQNKIRIYYPLADEDRSYISSPFSLFNLKIKNTKKDIFKDNATQKKIREAINKALRKEAKKHLPKKIDDFARRFGLNYKAVTMRDTKTRWGSCSSDNKISLNIQLMRLPEELIDYVLLHELAHCIEKNHSARFWQLLDSFTTSCINKKAKALDKELRKFSTRIY